MTALGFRAARQIAQWMAAALLAGFVVAMATPSRTEAAAHGRASAAGPYGDFNGDGHHDLAVGVHYQDVVAGGITYEQAGVVQVIYGTVDGLNGDSPVDDQIWHQGRPGILGGLEAYDHFGSTLAWGDFDGDGYDDLAVGVPHEDHDAGNRESGAVNVIFGSLSGLTSSGSQFLEQGVGGLLDAPEEIDLFGLALAVGNFGNGGRADLAIGAPYEDLPGSHGSTLYEAGAVSVVYGSATGLTATGNQFFTECYFACIPGTPVARDLDHFGSALAAANFGNGDSADLAAGIPGDDRGTVNDAGAVAVLYGSANGLTETGRQYWNATFGYAERDRFGDRLAAADFGRSPHADLAIGAPGYDLNGGASDTGAVFVTYGAPTGLSDFGVQYWHKDIPGVPGAASPGDDFGRTLAAANFGNDATADLAIGSNGNSQAGAVTVLYGTSGDGLAATGAQRWSQDSPGIADRSEDQDYFGLSLAAADFGGSAEADLAVGVPYEDLEVGGVLRDNEVGGVNVVYGSLGGLSADGNQFWWQRNRSLKGSPDSGEFFGIAVA